MGLPRRVGSGRVPQWRLRKWVPAVWLAGVGGAALAVQPPGVPPMTAAPGQTAPAKPAAAEPRFNFKFVKTPWPTVFEWFEQKSGLKINTQIQPTGTATLTVDNKTIPEIVDLFNEALGQDKFVMVRGVQSFTIFSADVKVPREYVRRIGVDQLNTVGRTEWVEVSIPLKTGMAADVVKELSKLKTEFGEVVALGSTIIITDKAATVDALVKYVESFTKPVEGDSLNHVCKYLRAQQVADNLRTLLKDSTTVTDAGANQPGVQPGMQPGIQPGMQPVQGGGRDGRGGNPGSPDPRFRTVQVAVNEATNTVFVTGPADKIGAAQKLVKDIDVPAYPGQKERPVGGAPTAIVYDVPAGTATASAAILTKTYTGSSITQVRDLPGGNQIMVYALPADHFDIAGMLKPQVAPPPGVQSELIPLSVLDPTKTAETIKNTLAPKDGTTAAMTVEVRTDGNPGLLIRGTPVQLKEAKDLITLLGEPNVAGGGGAGPLNKGRVRTVTIDRGNAGVVADGLADLIRKLRPGAKVEVGGVERKPAPKPKPVPTPGDDMSAAPRRLDPQYVLAQVPGVTAKPGDAPLTITVVGNTLLITCDDPELLDLATTVVRKLLSGTGEEINEVIKLKNVSAKDAADVINEVFNGTAPASGTGGGGGRRGFDPLALLGFGGGGGGPPAPVGGATPGRVKVVAEKASNSLIVVKASPADLLQIRALLAQAIDSGTANKTWTIPLKYAAAADVAETITETFHNLTARAPAGQQQYNPFGGGQPQQPQPPAALSVSSDKASNQVIVYCDEGVYEDVLKLCTALDKSTKETASVVEVVKLNGLNPTQVQQAIEALVGKKKEEPDSNPYGGFYGGYGGYSGYGRNSRGGSGRNSGNNRGRSSLDARPGGGWLSPPGGRDFFDDRGMDAPSAVTSLIYDPEAPVLTTEVPSVFQVAHQVPGGPPVPKGGPPASQSVQRPTPSGDVTAEALEQLGVIILRGRTQADIDAIKRFIELLRADTANTEIEVRTITLKVADANELAGTLVKFYERFSIDGGVKKVVSAPEQPFSYFYGRVDTGPPQTAGSLLLFPIPRFNQIVVAAPKGNIAEVVKQIESFDRRNDPALAPKAYPLKTASAQVLSQQLQNFFSSRYPSTGAGTSATKFTFDARQNTLYVQAAPGDQAEISELVGLLDTGTSSAVNQVEVIRLRNAFAGEIQQVIQRALSAAVVNPNTAIQGAGAGGQGRTVQGGFGGVNVGGGGGGGNQQNQGGGGGNQQNQGGGGGNQQNQQGLNTLTGQAQGITTKTTTLRLVSAQGGLPVDSGPLEDVHITPVERVNGLLVSAPEKSMLLIKRLIQELDVVAAAQSNVNVFTLKKADATATANLLFQLFSSGQAQGGGQQAGGQGGQFGQGGAFGQQGGQGAQQQGANRPLLTLTGNPSEGAGLVGLRITPDTRTNSIFVAGSRTDLDTINAIIARLEDAQAPDVRPTVYKVRNQAAADIAQAVTSFINAQATQINSQFVGGSAFQNLQRNVVVVAEPVSNTLLISATAGLAEDIGRLIAQIDAAPPQVLVQVVIAEVLLNGREEFGVEIGIQSPVLFARSSIVGTTAPGTAVNPGFNFNTTAPLGNTTTTQNNVVGFQGLGNLGVGRAGANGVGGFVFSAASDSVNVLVRALKTQGKAEVLSRPQLLLTDNQQGFFQVGQSFPTLDATVVSGTGLAQQSIVYRDIGIVLRVVPRISPEGRVLMRVEPQVSAVNPNPVSLGGGLATAFDIQTLQTTVNAGDGETVILGGLIRKSDAKNENKIPVLGDLPYVGALFRYRTQDVSRRELLFIVTPHIIRNELDMFRLTQVEAGKMSWNYKDVVDIHSYGADVLRGPQAPTPYWCDPRVNPTLGAPAGFPYNSPALDPAAVPQMGVPLGTIQTVPNAAPADGVPTGAAMPRSAPVLNYPPPVPVPAVTPAEASGFPPATAAGAPTVYAPAADTPLLPTAGMKPAANSSKEGQKSWSVFRK